MLEVPGCKQFGHVSYVKCKLILIQPHEQPQAAKPPVSVYVFVYDMQSPHAALRKSWP